MKMKREFLTHASSSLCLTPALLVGIQEMGMWLLEPSGMSESTLCK